MAALIWLAALRFVSGMIPGSRSIMTPGTLLATVSLLLIAIFALLFHNYRTEHFVHRGISCLTAGLLNAIPAALGSWLILHRGIALSAVSAGLAQGTLAGLAGVTMLELHCPNFEAPHVMLWHTAVIPFSGACGSADRLGCALPETLITYTSLPPAAQAQRTRQQ